MLTREAMLANRKHRGGKIQAPSTRHQRNTKFQTAISGRAGLMFAAWCFSGAWCLKLGAWFLALCLITGCMPAGPGALLDGKRLVEQGKYPQAIKKLTNATSLLPTNA